MWIIDWHSIFKKYFSNLLCEAKKNKNVNNIKQWQKYNCWINYSLSKHIGKLWIDNEIYILVVFKSCLLSKKTLLHKKCKQEGQ